MTAWTPETARRWFVRHMDRQVFRPCYLAERWERRGGHWSEGLSLLAALRRFGLVRLIPDEGQDVPHAPARRGGRKCRGRKGTFLYAVTFDFEPAWRERLRTACDADMELTTKEAIDEWLTR